MEPRTPSSANIRPKITFHRNSPHPPTYLSIKLNSYSAVGIDPGEKKRTMPEQEVEIPTQDGSSDSVLLYPDGEGTGPGILYFTDIAGIRPTNRESAARVSKQGYVVLMPNIFYRTGRAPMRPPFRDLDADARGKRIAELSGPLTPETMERDASTYIDFLASQPRTRKGMLAVVGHCFSGKMAMYAAAARADRVAAVASFHGGGLYTDAPTSPHLILPRIKAKLYFGHATGDRSMPAEGITKFEDALKRWGGKYESETYKDAQHGWTSADSPVFNQIQAERAYGKLLELLQETLS
jgi:carboxymethylenebutenolidase